MKAVVELKEACVRVTNGVEQERVILDGVSLTIFEHDFLTILGGNGAGKSTLFNVLAGTQQLTSGQLLVLGQDVTHWPAERRARFIARVFQDPKMGTAPRMTVAENLLIATYRGEKRGLSPRRLAAHASTFSSLLSRVGNGLEQHLDTPTGFLSGGQRQALSLLMASLKRPDLLLLDEHTAALDPKTSRSLMHLTDELIHNDQLTALMVTHQMEDALAYGNRLLVMKDGRIVKDLSKQEKDQLRLDDYYQMFEV